MNVTIEPSYSVGAMSTYFSLLFNRYGIEGISTVFQSFFDRPGSMGNKHFISDSSQISYDEQNNKIVISEMNERTQQAGHSTTSDLSKGVNKMSYRNVTRVFPLISENWSVDYDSLLMRAPGENPIQTTSSNGSTNLRNRLRYQVAERFRSTIPGIVTRCEVASLEVLAKGKMTYDNGNFIDFDRSSKNTIEATLPFTEENAVIIEDIDALSDALTDNSGMMGDFIIPSASTYAAMVKNLQVQKLADNRRFGFIQLGESGGLPSLPANFSWFIKSGLAYSGYLTTYKGRGFHIFQHNHTYTTKAGLTRPYLDDDWLIMGNSKAVCDVYYGPATEFPSASSEVNKALGFNFQSSALTETANMLKNSGNGVDSRAFHVTARLEPSIVTGKIVKSPLYIPNQIDAFGLITGTVETA